MRIKRFLSVVLCLVFVMSLFPFSAAAENGDFAEEDNEQDIPVSEAVYAEQSTDIDNKNYDNISLDDMNNKGEPETPGAIPSGANSMQMMTLEGSGDDEEPILKTSHEFPEVTGTFEVRIPKEGEEDEDSYVYCDVSFIPSIEEGVTPFFIANGLYGNEEVYTIRENNIDDRADINEEDIYIEHPDLVEAGETRIIFSEEYYNDTGIELYYKIFFEVDFYSLKVPGELLGTVRSEVNVNDSPFLGVYVDYGGQISTHYHEYWAAYIEEDIWNSTVQVNIKRESGEEDPALRTEPVAGVPTKIFYYWGSSDAPYCIFKPTDSWETTDSDGSAAFIIGVGSNIIERDIGIPAPVLYGKLVKGLGQDNLAQYYTYTGLKDFEGIIKVKVVNTENEPLKGRTVQFWGGVKYDYKTGDDTDDQGIATIRYPSTTVSTDEKELTMTELPTFSLKWNLTQVIDNPERIVDGHNAPLYLSPEIYVSEGYSKNPYTEIRGVKLQVYDVESPDKVLIETSPRAFKEKYDEQRDIVVRGAHRAYIKISPQDWKSKKLGIRAVVPNKDEGAREKYQVRAYVEDKTSARKLYVPKKTFTFAFVPLRVGSEENNSSVSYGSLGQQKEFIRKIFPAPVKFVEKSPMFIAKPRFSTHNMYLSRIFRELDRTQKLFSDKYDLYIGMTPPKFLGAAGLQDSGMFGMNWSFLGAAHGAVLIDPSQVLPHTTLHEIIHTLGLGDVYSEDGVQLQSANGHDGTPINNVLGKSPANEPIMYDHASTPWPTEGEYNALLNYATKPALGKMGLLSMSTFSENPESEVILLSGNIEDVRSYQKKVYFDPIVKHTGYADESSDYSNNGYVIQTLASDGGVLSQYFFSDYEFDGKYYAAFIANLPADGVKAIEIGKQEYGSITQVFQRYEYSENAPVVSITGPAAAPLSGDFMITWDARDEDEDALLSEVQVSSDGGNSWNTIAVDVPYIAGGKYSHKLNASNFPKGTNYKFKVIVTDGMHLTEAVSGNEYTIVGYEQKPILNLSGIEATVQVNPGTKEAAAYFELGNSGKEELNVKFSLDDEISTFVSPLFIKEYTIYPGQNQLIAIPLILPGESEDILEETINLITNDPDKPTTNLTINVEYTEDTLKPELASFSTTPSDFSQKEQESDIQVTIEAYAAAGQRGLEATVIIEDEDGKEILNEQMGENYNKPGAYTYYWEPEDLPVGNYGVYIGLEDTESGLERERKEYDFTFSIKATNAPPVFEEPQTYENDLGVVNRGETITIPYEVNDPDNDTLDIAVYSNLLEHGLDLIMDTGNSGRIEWEANVSGAHSIYLTATDPSGNSAEVMFNIAEIQDLNLFTISLEALSTEAGQVYGSGLYNSGEYVTVEAVPGELYKFISWTEDDGVVSTDPVYMFKATKDRRLVANFEEAVVFQYDIEDNEVIITGFADEVLEDFEIPNEIEGYPVTGIGDTAFYSKGIKSVNLPDTLTNIGINAFPSNRITEAIIPNSVNTIGDYAFGNNDDLVEVVIPNPNTVIGEGAFFQCSPDLIIYGVPGSSANSYATANSIIFKDIDEYGGDIPAAKYEITVADVVGGTAIVTTNPATLAEEGVTVTINIGSIQSGRQFKSITVIDAESNNVAITEATAGRKYTFTMPAKNVTVTANLKTVSDSGGGNSNGGNRGGGSSGSSGGSGGSLQPTVPAADGSTKVNYTVSGGTAALTLPNTKVDEIITKSKEGEAVFDLSKVSGVTAAELPKTAVTAMNEAGLDVTFVLSGGSITLNKDAVASVAEQAEESSMKLELKQVAPASLTNEQKEAVKSGDLVLDINISSGMKKISSFDGTLTITVPYNGPRPVAVWYLNDKGDLEKLSCTFKDGAVSFDLDHLSLYIVGQDTEEPAWLNPFTDVKEADWFYDAVNYINKAGLMAGTSETDFSPYTDTTRGMIVTILHRLEGKPKAITANSFTDVGADKYYTDAVAWASDNKIVSGYGNGIFGPVNAITREQLTVILMNYAKYKGYDVSMRADLFKFTDVEYVSTWSKDAMSWANAEGLIQGSGNQLMPVGNAQRSQVAAILQRFIETISK